MTIKKQRRNTIEIFNKFDGLPNKLAVVTAYDAPTAALADKAGVDAILVGDSIGMTVFGESTTLGVTMDDIVRATKSVVGATENAFIIADMPFMSYQISVEEGIKNAGRLIAEGGANAIKLEGAAPPIPDLVFRLVESGIPVVGHLGLTPQSINSIGKFGPQASNASGILNLIMGSRALQDVGACAVVLEYVPEEVAEYISSEFGFVTIGIGSGAECDGEVQVMHDILGLGAFKPKHTKQYANLDDVIGKALSEYVTEVRNGAFPSAVNTSSVDDVAFVNALGILEELDRLDELND